MKHGICGATVDLYLQ